MTREATFLVQAFNDSKGGRLKPTPPVACRSADGARRTAERLSLSHVGVVAFSITSDPDTGDYDDQPTRAVARRIRLNAVMFTLSTLLLDNGLPDQPILLIEPHRNRVGIWRIKFCYDDVEPLSMNAEQASKLAIRLHQMGQDELACEIDEAVGRAKHYDSM